MACRRARRRLPRPPRRRPRPGRGALLVDCESDPAVLAGLLRERPGVEGLPLAENRGFAGGANAGLEHAFAAGASHAVLLNDDVLVEPGCIEAPGRRRRRRAARRRRASTARPASRSPARELELRRGFGRHVEGALDYLTGACICFSRGGLGDRRPVRRVALPLLRGRRLEPARARARRPARRRAGGARVARRGRVERRRAGRDLGLLLDAQPPLAARAAARRHRTRAARPCARACARGCGRCGRRAAPVSLAKLAGVRDWSERRMGRGPWPA